MSNAASRAGSIRRIVLTGASGFIGRWVLRELVSRGYHVVCPARSASRLAEGIANLDASRISVVQTSLFEPESLSAAIGQADAAVHLVGIIIEQQRAGQTFDRIHVEATRAVLEACHRSRVWRFIHVSALGARPDAPSRYHQTKWAAEELVRGSGLEWTVFRPSVVHGPDGEFMRLVKRLVTGVWPPMLPCFGSGRASVQPVYVEDLARIIADSLRLQAAVGHSFEVGGPERLTWRQLYRTCRQTIPGSCRFKPVVPLPVRLVAAIAHLGDCYDRLFGTRRILPLLPAIPFGYDQVLMSQEDNVCDVEPVRQTFGIDLRGFSEMLSQYAARIRP